MSESVDEIVQPIPFENKNIWSRQANCIGMTKLFFAPEHERPRAKIIREAHAKFVCASCTVIEPCREYAREHRESGIWGGETDEERVLAGYRPKHFSKRIPLIKSRS
jgi:WhiB family redox-sensing transcriptional regulator